MKNSLLVSFLAMFGFMVLNFIGCTNQEEQPKDIAIQNGKNPNTIYTDFSDIDTTKSEETIGCGNIYKLINKNYILCISPPLPAQFGKCYNISIDSSNTKLYSELMVYDNNDATLKEVCCDVFINREPIKPRWLSAKSGHIIVGYSDPIIIDDSPTFRTTIFIDSLIFYDSKTKKFIELKNELLWKVLTRSIPG